METRLRDRRGDATVVDVPKEIRRQPADPGEHEPQLIEGMPRPPGCPIMCRTCGEPRPHVHRCEGEPKPERTKADILTRCQVCRRRVTLVCQECGTEHRPVRTYGGYNPGG